MMERLNQTEICFPHRNTSCRPPVPPQSEAILICSLQSIITVLTVVLNLLVIISISHFRQLHTTTNLLVLSLAVADFLVGLLQMPSEIILPQGCLLLGDFICLMNFFLSYYLVSVSVGNLVLISVDRYLAICDPMLYSTKVTARAMRSHIAAVTFKRSEMVKPKKSEYKAARTLGVVVFVFLLCSSPYYFYTVAADNNAIENGSAAIWLLYFNSCVNPLIYAFFYPWFRKSVKHIVTLQILQPDSRYTSVL
ncbi:trace amine-associated receptor 13c-like [Channa argus]|uniref:trace amine-associated receptor 13c-like n=1 Tax=Channa argus TaxID=215402 RepID=UPI0035200354